MTDVLIIGGGPAGVTAALYTARAGLKTTIIYKDHGALGKAERIENYYGHTEISGNALAETGLEHAQKVGTEIITGEVVGLSINDQCINVKTATVEYQAKTVVLATGANRVTPQIPGLSEHEGCGVSYCAICDGFFYKGKDVAVLGSGEYALHEAKDLLPLAATVTLLTNGKEPEVPFPTPVAIRKEKIKEVYGGAATSGIPGIKGLSSLPTRNALKGVMFENDSELHLSGLFIAVGIAGGTDLARKIGAVIDSQGSVKVDNKMQTSVPGLWAAGDCTGGLKQIAKAVYEGAEAGMDIIKHLRD